MNWLSKLLLVLAVIVLLIGIARLVIKTNHRSNDQKILIEKSK